MVKDVFLSITPRSHEYIDCNVEGIPLRVIQGSVNASPDIKFNVTSLNNGSKHFHNSSGKADSFSISILIHEDDTVFVTKEFNDLLVWSKELLNHNFTEILEYSTKLNGVSIESYAKLGKYVKVLDVLDYFIRNKEPIFVATRAVGINNDDMWVITENKNRTQEYNVGWVEWDLTFTKYVPYDFASFKNDNTIVTKALKKTKTNAKTTAKSKTTLYDTLKKCKRESLVYSKTKKVVPCVKTMQQILKNKKFYKSSVDGWYGKQTMEAVKSYQKKYKTRDNLNVTGRVDLRTFNSLCGQVGQTVTLKSNLLKANSSGVIDTTKLK